MKKKRLLALVLSLIMIITSVVPAFAETEVMAEEAVEEVFFGEEFSAEAAEAAEAAEGEAADSEEKNAEANAETEQTALAAMLGTSGIGDLWEGWDSYGEDTSKPNGTGTESDPYVLKSAANLMWLSVNVAAGTTGAADGWYILGNTISLSELPFDWNPIGWYANAGASSIGSVRPFKGHFDGGGYRITDLDMAERKKEQYCGLFGVLEDAEVKNLTVVAETITGANHLGILAGASVGKTTVRYVTVKGFVKTPDDVAAPPSASAYIGGMIGSADGGSISDASGLVMENCKADGVRITSPLTTDASIGGLIGYAGDAYLVDSYVITSNDGVKGIGYVGGIVGQMTDTKIYNSKVEGLVGGNGALAIGGIAGLYKGGEIILSQMDADLGNSSLATHEGIIAGNFGSGADLIYGNTDSSTAAYLFYDKELDGLPIVGSGNDRDMRGFTKDANIGYWTDAKLKYTLVEGTKIYPCGDSDFYYEALESGVRYIVVQKLNRSFTVEDYAAGLRFSIDHFAPGSTGSPVLGYLVSIPRIDSGNSTDIDVAYFTAQAKAASAWYKVMDMTTAAAVAPGATVEVIASAKNDPANNKYFQRVSDLTVDPEKVTRPTYTDSTSGTTEKLPMTYRTGGSYTFVMPACNTELNVDFEKVLSGVTTSPTTTKFTIVETRTGDRKNPAITWKITDENGHTLCNNVTRTRTEGNDPKEQLLANTDVTPIDVAAIFNSVSLDNKAEWSVDDASLLNITGTDVGFTASAAKVKPEVSEVNTWMLQLINSAELAQKAAGYTTAIPATVYTKKAVLTASTDPAHSIDYMEMAAHCEITLSFKIDDQTTLQVEGVSLDKDSLTYTVTRKLTGNRRAPVESWTVTGPQSVKASVNPADAFVKNVTWEITGDAATSVTKTASGTYDHDLSVASVFDGSDPLTLPAWMAELYAADNAAKAADKNYVMNKAGSKTATLTVTAEDKDKGVHRDTAAITVNYVTVDETPDVAKLSLNTDNLAYTVTRTLTGDRKAPAEEYRSTSSKKLTASLSGNAPFLENVIWSVDSSLEPATVRTLSGTFHSTETIGVNFDPADIESAPAWIANVISSDDDRWNAGGKAWKRSATASVEGFITAKSNDVTIPDGTAEIAKCKVTINFVTDDQTVIHPEGVEVNPVSIEETYTIKYVGDTRSDIESETGFEDKDITHVVLPNLSFIPEHLPYNRAVEWSVSDTDAVSITQEGKLSFNKNAKWIKDAKEAAPYAATKTVSVYCTAKDNGKVGVTTVKLNFKTVALELPADSKTVNIVYTASGPSSSPKYEWTGLDAFSMKASTYPDLREVTYTSGDLGTLAIDAQGNVTVPVTKDTEWIKESMKKYPYTGQAVVVLEAEDALCTDSCEVVVNFRYVNNTYSTSSGGSGGGGGGGGGVSGMKPAAAPTYSQWWYQTTAGLWRIRNKAGADIKNAWLCDDAVKANGTNVWYLIDGNGDMVARGLVQDNTGNYYSIETNHTGYYGMLRYRNGTYDGIYMEFSQAKDGNFGAITNQSAIDALKAKYGVTHFDIDNSNCSYTAQF